MGEVEPVVFRLGRIELADLRGQVMDAANADPGQWHAVEDARGGHQALAHQAIPVLFRRHIFEPVHQPLGGQRTLGEARLLQVSAGAAHRFLENRVAEQVVVAIATIGQQVVRVEVKAHLRRKVRQPEHRALQPGQAPLGQGAVQRQSALFRLTEGGRVQARAEALAQRPDDVFRRHPVGDQRHAAELDDGQIGERQPRGQAEGHRLAHGQAGMGQQVGHHPAFAVGALAVLEGAHRGNSCW